MFDPNMPLKIDPNAAQTTSFEPVPKGEYEVYITELKPGESSQKKTPMIEVVFTIRDDVPGQKFGRRKVFDRLFLTEKALFRLNNLMVAAGAGAGDKTVGYAIQFLQSKPVVIGIDHESYTANDGTPKVREVVKYYKASNVGGTGPAAASGGNPFSDPFAGNSAPVNISDDDLPF